MFYGNYNCNYNNCCDIREILYKIVKLQREAVASELPQGCCRDVLGEENRCDSFNTRPVTFYTSENREMEFPVSRYESGCNREDNESCVFRVECVNNNTCQCRVLVECGRKCGRIEYCATDSFVTIRLDDIASCRCLPDTFVDLCIK